MVERSNPTSEERQLRGCRKAERRYSTIKVRRDDLVQGKEQRLCFAGAAVKKYPTFKVRNPSKTVGLACCSPWGRKESDTTERLHFHFSLSCIGEGNDNPLQCSCLENPRDGGAWWAAIYEVAQSRTQLK